MEISSKHLHYQTVRARELKLLEKVDFPPPVICHMSLVTCHVASDMCHILHVTFLLYLVQSGATSRWRVCVSLIFSCPLPHYQYKTNFILISKTYKAMPWMQFVLWYKELLYRPVNFVSRTSVTELLFSSHYIEGGVSRWSDSQELTPWRKTFCRDSREM